MDIRDHGDGTTRPGIGSDRMASGRRWRGRLARRARIIVAALLAAVVALGAGGAVWWTVGGGKYTVRLMGRAPATPATQDAVDAVTGFAYRSAPRFLAEGDGDGNANYSPASMWMALALAAQGTGGETRAQLDEALGGGRLTDEDYTSLRSSVNGRYGDARSVMDMRDSVWVDSRYTLKETFRQAARDRFDADVESLAFDGRAERRMSRWIEDNTRGMLAPDISLNADTMLSIIDTVYADGRWSTPFEPEDTEDGTFHGLSSERNVPMMFHSFDSLGYAKAGDDSWQRVSIPFDNGGVLTILLPAEGRFDEFASGSARLQWAMSACSPRETGDEAPVCGANADTDSSGAATSEVAADATRVHLTLPRFSIDGMLSPAVASDTLRSMGVTDAFSAGTADFSGMLEPDDLPGSPFLGEIIQGTRIEVNEQGAKAAAFTQMQMEAGSAPLIGDEVTLVVDRPFLYELDTPDGVPLFIGAVRNL